MMKKEFFTTLALSLFLFASCSQDEVLNEVVETTTVSTRSTEDCVVSNNDYKVDYTLLQKYLKLTKKDADVQTITPLVREGDTLAYGVQYTQGWDFIAADQRLTPVMAYSKVGNFPQPLTEPIEGLLSHIQTIRSSSDKSPNGMWKLLTPLQHKDVATTRGGDYGNGMWIPQDTIYDNGSTSIPHLMSTKWGQGSPWNKYAPRQNGQRTVLGCTTIAVGQVANFFCTKKGKAGSVKIPISASITEGGTTFPVFSATKDTILWGNMANTYLQKDTINSAIFLAYLGTEMGVYWGINSTSGNINHIKSGLSICNLEYSHTESYSYSLLCGAVQSGVPAIVCTNEHAFIVDAYSMSYEEVSYTCKWDEQHEITEWESLNYPQEMFWPPTEYDENKEAYKEIILRYSESEYIGMNWGWNGYNDGFYIVRHYIAPFTDEAGYNPGGNIIYEPNWPTSAGNMNDVKHIIYNIH